MIFYLDLYQSFFLSFCVSFFLTMLIRTKKKQGTDNLGCVMCFVLLLLINNHDAFSNEIVVFWFSLTFFFFKIKSLKSVWPFPLINWIEGVSAFESYNFARTRIRVIVWVRMFHFIFPYFFSFNNPYMVTLPP